MLIHQILVNAFGLQAQIELLLDDLSQGLTVATTGNLVARRGTHLGWF